MKDMVSLLKELQEIQLQALSRGQIIDIDLRSTGLSVWAFPQKKGVETKEFNIYNPEICPMIAEDNNKEMAKIKRFFASKKFIENYK